jgi:uncharacterized protein (TIGR02217 family)
MMSTITQKPISGKETRLQLWTYPRYKWEVTFNVLPAGLGVGFGAASDFETFVGFWNSVAGSALPFHYADPVDFSVTAQPLGDGDGATTQFSCVRAFGGFVEPTQDVTQSGFLLYDNGSLVSGSAYTFLTDPNWGFTYGVQFNTAPLSGHAVTATFNYQWPCRFDEDSADFENFMWNLYSLKKITFTSMKVD